MKQKTQDPRKLDVAAFAEASETLSGEWPATVLERWAEVGAAQSSAAQWPAVRWQARGERRELRGGEHQLWLHLDVQAGADLVCQRCLGVLHEAVHLERAFRFVKDEDMAAELDADSDDDVLALPRRLDLQELVEDELLLALPLVPRHEQCPEQLPQSVQDDDFEQAEAEKVNPFAALAALKGKVPPAQ